MTSTIVTTSLLILSLWTYFRATSPHLVPSHTAISTSDTARGSVSSLNPPLRIHKNNAYQTGETLEFSIKYTGVTAVKTKISIPKDTLFRGEWCHHITYQARTVPVFDSFFPVDDQYESFIQRDGQYPLYFRQQIREGKFSHDAEIEFFHDKGIARSLIDHRDYSMEAFSQDIISSYFFVRTLELKSLKPGAVLSLTNFSDDHTNPLDIKVRYRDVLETEIGTLKTIVLEPDVKGRGLFKSEGRILVWVTDDDNKIPVRISMKVPVGSLSAEITRASGLKNSMTARINN